MRVRTFAATAVVLVTAACASNPFDNPKVTELIVTPKSVNPGEAVTFRFKLEYEGPWTDILSIELTGLPANTLAANTVTTINIPAAAGETTETVIRIKKPAKDGVYPLKFKVTMRASPGVNVGAVGPLTIKDVPAVFKFASFEPSSHGVGVCSGQRKFVSLKYLASDENGATDLTAPLVVRVDPAGLFDAPLPLRAPNNPNVIEELVTTPVAVNCNARAPQIWQWTLAATNIDTPSEAQYPTPTYVTEYVTSP